MNLKMTNLIIDKIFSQNLFEQNPESKELLQIIIQNMVIRINLYLGYKWL